MERLESYCLKVTCIDKLKTYILSPLCFEQLLHDTELFDSLFRKPSEIQPFIRIAGKVKNPSLYPAFIYNGAWVERYRYSPLLCCRYEDDFHHVHYHGAWRCRRCGHDNGAVIMPMSEADSVYYGSTGLPPVPSAFIRIPCRKCGTLLQNHLILADG